MSSKSKLSIFRGRFECRLNEKGRISLPAAYRQDSLEKKLVVTNSIYNKKKCLDVYTLKQWNALEKVVMKLPRLKPEVQSYQRFYIAGGQELKLDNQFRILIPQSLRKYAELEKDVMIVGLGEKFEIWSSTEWAKIFKEIHSNFDQITEVVSGCMNEK